MVSQRLLSIVWKILGCLLLVSLCLARISPAWAQATPEWHEWSREAFLQAGREKKLVLLHLEAVWCHWCHVMEKETYSNSEVLKELSTHYVSLKVDQDARPDLSARFRDYGWPATIIFNPAGEVLAKRAGFIPAKEFLPLLKQQAANPTVEPETKKPRQAENIKGSEVAKQLIERHYRMYDLAQGGLKLQHKYLEYDSLEYSLLSASQGSKRDEQLVQTTLHSALKLIDPVWGGIYQYSVRGDWEHPHFEKLLVEQARAIILYTDAYRLWGSEEYLSAAERIAEYVFSFLTSPEGAFYTSQDADVHPGEHAEPYFQLNDQGRRALGIPRVDTNLCARENGLMIRALVRLFTATGNRRYFVAAERAADWVLKHRTLSGGGFSHGEEPSSGPFLADAVSMGEALLSLYSAGAERSYLMRARELVSFIEQHFLEKGARPNGILTSAEHPRELLKPQADCEENIQVARFANLLYQYTGMNEARGLAKRALAYISRSEVALGSMLQSGVLLAMQEFETDPLHITVVGRRGDSKSEVLLGAALKYYSAYKRSELWDRAEGALPREDVSYPDLGEAAAFICSNQRCSLPIREPQQISEMIRQLSQTQP